MAFEITRRIEIDAAHRVPLHGSKCRNLHGHRYVIEATCSAPELVKEGEQSGMVLDFGFLKAAMIEVIHDECDHATILQVEDPFLQMLIPANVINDLKRMVLRDGWGRFTRTSELIPVRLYVIQEPPTAEVLARHWGLRLAPMVDNLTNHVAYLSNLRVYETPNCFADYPGR